MIEYVTLEKGTSSVGNKDLQVLRTNKEAYAGTSRVLGLKVWNKISFVTKRTEVFFPGYFWCELRSLFV